jgi:hypothetical protein
MTSGEVRAVVMFWGLQVTKDHRSTASKVRVLTAGGFRQHRIINLASSVQGFANRPALMFSLGADA